MRNPTVLSQAAAEPRLRLLSAKALRETAGRDERTERHKGTEILEGNTHTTHKNSLIAINCMRDNVRQMVDDTN